MTDFVDLLMKHRARDHAPSRGSSVRPARIAYAGTAIVAIVPALH